MPGLIRITDINSFLWCEMDDIPCEYSFYISEGMGYVMDEGGSLHMPYGRKPIRLSS